MGVDIHVSIEKRTASEWEFCEYVDLLPRCHDLFQYLGDCGHKDDSVVAAIEAIAPYRGLPDGVTERTKRRVGNMSHSMLDFDQNYGHSWVTLREIDEHPAPEGCADLVAELREIMARHGSGDDVRMVFSFDC